VLSVHYTSEQEAFEGIKKLYDYYLQSYPDFYAKNTNLVKVAVDAITAAYADSVFPDQKMDWTTHADNLQHTDSPGCFRCHDGKHVSINGKDTVRLECNLCHSIPTVSTSFQLVTNIPLEKGFEPVTHTNPNWINLHRSTFDKTCETCHTTADAGGTSNKSFCSNSICHGSTFKFTWFDAPKLKVLLDAQKPTPAPTTPTPIPTVAPTPSSAQPTAAPTTQAPANGAVTFSTLAPIFQDKCGQCHGDAAIKGLSLTTFEKTMAGGADGPVIVSGKPDDSLIIKKLADGNHPGQLSADEMTLLKQWITAGAPEK
jgi:mono/diheme cytochrome c family protein